MTTTITKKTTGEMAREGTEDLMASVYDTARMLDKLATHAPRLSPSVRRALEKVADTLTDAAVLCEAAWDDFDAEMEEDDDEVTTAIVVSKPIETVEHVMDSFALI